MAFGGAVLRVGGVVLRALEFGASAVALGIFSYFLAVQSKNGIAIPQWQKAVEGISGAAVLYTIFGLIFTLCLGGVAAFGFLAVVLDVCFVGCFVAVAILTRQGAGNCNGYVRTPLGDGYANDDVVGLGSFHYACRLNTVVFAISIILIFLFLFTAIYQVGMVRHHRKEKAAGTAPSKRSYLPSGGHRGGFWNKNKKHHNTHDAEAATAMPATHYHESAVRPSHETGTTVGNTQYTTEPKFGQPGYGQRPHY